MTDLPASDRHEAQPRLPYAKPELVELCLGGNTDGKTFTLPHESGYLLAPS